MGVKTDLAAITLTAGDKTKMHANGIDVAGLLELAQLKCDEITAILNTIITDVMTPAGDDSANITTLQGEITALS